jgi:hypothetical protein
LWWGKERSINPDARVGVGFRNFFVGVILARVALVVAATFAVVALCAGLGIVSRCCADLRPLGRLLLAAGASILIISIEPLVLVSLLPQLMQVLLQGGSDALGSDTLGAHLHAVR